MGNCTVVASGTNPAQPGLFALSRMNYAAKCLYELHKSQLWLFVTTGFYAPSMAHNASPMRPCMGVVGFRMQFYRL